MEITTINQEKQERLIAELLDIPKERLDTYSAEICSYNALSNATEEELKFALCETLKRVRQFTTDLEKYLTNH